MTSLTCRNWFWNGFDILCNCGSSERNPHSVFLVTGGDAALTDEITADGQNGVSFIHPMGEIFLQPLAGETDSPHHLTLTVTTTLMMLVDENREEWKSQSFPSSWLFHSQWLVTRTVLISVNISLSCIQNSIYCWGLWHPAREWTYFTVDWKDY